MYHINLENNTINSGYIKTPGAKLNIEQKKVTSDSEYLIATCNDVGLFSDYINQSEKRIYVLLDKNISSSDLPRVSNNVWLIRTDMELPNLISSQDVLYSVTLSQFVSKEVNKKNIFNFLKGKVIEYVQKYKGLDVNSDFVYIENDDVVKTRISDLATVDAFFPELYDLVISNDYDLIPKYMKSRNNYSRNFIELRHDDYGWMIKDHKVNQIIKENGDAYILTTGFNFDIDTYERYEYFEQKTFKELQDIEAYKPNLEKIIIDDVVSRKIDVTTDLLVRNNEKKLTELLENELNKVNTKGVNALRVDVDFNLLNLKLKDIKNSQKYKNLEHNEVIYDNGKNKVLVVDKYLNKYKDMDFKYVLKN